MEVRKYWHLGGVKEFEIDRDVRIALAVRVGSREIGASEDLHFECDERRLALFRDGV